MSRAKKNAPTVAAVGRHQTQDVNLKTGSTVSHDDRAMAAGAPQSDFSAPTRPTPRPGVGNRTSPVLVAQSIIARDPDQSAAWVGDLYTTLPARAAALQRIFEQSGSTATNTQLGRLLTALRTGPLTTLEARRYLDVLAVSARMCDLQDAGHRIVAGWIKQCSDLGRSRRVKQYFLLREAAK